MSSAVQDMINRSRQMVTVTSDLCTAPAGSDPGVFTEEELADSDTLRAILPERAMMFRELFVDFTDMLAMCRPSEIRVIKGPQDRLPLELLYVHGKEDQWMGRHLRQQTSLGHLDSLDGATYMELILATRVVFALFTSLDRIEWSDFLDMAGPDKLLTVEHAASFIDESDDLEKSWLAGRCSCREDNGEPDVWFRVNCPLSLVTPDPLLPLMITGVDRSDKDAVIVHGAGGDLAFEAAQKI